MPARTDGQWMQEAVRCMGLDDLRPFVQEHAALAQRLLNADLTESLLIPMNGQQRTALCEESIRCLEFHTESAINVRSLAVLRELFAS